MSWPLNYDPASQSMSFEGRDKALYPNSLASFEQAVLAAGDICLTYCDRGSNRRPSPENAIFEFGYKKVENKEAEGTGSGEDCCAFDTSLHDTTSISHTDFDELEESRQKRFEESLARGKWNRYRRQYTSNTSYEAHKSPNSFFIHDRASTHPNFPTNLPYVYLSVGGCAALSDQALRDLSLKNRTSEGGEWSSVSWPVSPAASIITAEKDLVIVNIDHGTSEAKSRNLSEKPCSPQSSVEEKPAPIRAYPCPRQAHFAFKLPNKKTSRDLNVRHKQSFFQRLLHPKENIIKPLIQLATEIFCLKHNKIELPEKQPLDVDIPKSVAKAVEKGSEKEKEREAVAL